MEPDRTADAAADRPAPLPGQPAQLGDVVLDGWSVTEIHRGGQAWVLVLDGRDGRRALKLPAAASVVGDAELGVLLGLAPHPRVVTVLDVVEFRGQQGIVMEYVPYTLGGLFRRSADRVSLLPVLQEICDGMAHLSTDAEFAHLDLKPSNVLVDHAGHVKIADFGLAHHVRTPDGRYSAAAGGTWAYSAPEVLRGQPCDSRADVFSFGVVLYELCTGRRPYPFALEPAPTDQRAQLLAYYDSSGPEQRTDELYHQLAPTQVPVLPSETGVGEVLSGCLQTDMAERPPTFRDLAARIARAMRLPEVRASAIRLPEIDWQRREMTLCAALVRQGRLDDAIRRLNRLLCTSLPAPLSADAGRVLRRALVAAGREDDGDGLEAWL